MKKYKRIYKWTFGIGSTLIWSFGIISEMMREIIDPIYKTSLTTALIYTFFFFYGVYCLAYMIDYSINKGDYNDE